ncbi:DUF4435 domain-containing protein [Pseudomonas protegens]|uniref:DUF4435 domain-containing protein n=1 Tax=Pseudomonas protegens TaxID=380021 RepID=UPI003824375F
MYSEGGLYDAEKGCSEWSIDVVFWKSIFSKFLPSLRYKITPMGSKENVKPFADKIVSSEITNTIVAMDRDHDAHKDSIIRHPCIFYTYGYSWENDAWRAEVIISKLKKLSPGQDISSELSQSIRSRWVNFNSDFRRLVFVDVLCSIKNVKGLDRDRFWGYVDKSNLSRIKVKKDKLKVLIKEMKSRHDEPFRYVGKHVVSCDRDCYGKLFSMFFYELFCDAYKSVTGAKNLNRFDADIMLAEHIELFPMNIFEPDMHSYYMKLAGQLEHFLRVRGLENFLRA